MRFCSFSLVNPDVLSELIGLIITEPSKEIEESARFRLPHIAAEILSCEVPQINEQVCIRYLTKQLREFKCLLHTYKP